MDVTSLDRADDQGLLLGAGFTFGIACALLIVAIVLLSVPGLDVTLTSSAVLTALAGAVFAGIVGGTLFVLSFGENRDAIPVDDDRLDQAEGTTNEDGASEGSSGHGPGA